MFEHEATTSKISEDQMFYCQQRGLSAEEATALIVNGFVKDVLQHLPMEFAVEAQKLISISLEGWWANPFLLPSGRSTPQATDGGGASIARHCTPHPFAVREGTHRRFADTERNSRCSRSTTSRPDRGQADPQRLSLTVHDGEVAAIMGPNGSGKSTLSYVIAGKDGYEVLDGEILLDGQNLLEMGPDERAAAGVFLAFQYPLEIPGVATMTFLKAALNAQRKARGDDELSTPDFMKRVRAAAEAHMPKDMLKRALNVGFSGGEKKRMEILQMALLEPTLLHPRRDRLRARHRRPAHRRRTASTRCASPERSFLVITHYQRLLNYIVPDTRARDVAAAGS